MTLRWAKSFEMQKIAVVDVAPVRLELAERGGATHCLAGSLAEQRQALLALSAANGFEIVIDTTGNAVGVCRSARRRRHVWQARATGRHRLPGPTMPHV